MNANPTAVIFPGQGSQALGMGKELATAYPVARQVFDQADDLLGFALSRLAWEGPEDALNDTINTQPALLVHSIAALRVLEQLQPGFAPAFVAGHIVTGRFNPNRHTEAVDDPAQGAAWADAAAIPDR